MNSQLENIEDASNEFQRGSKPSIGYDSQANKLIIIRNLGSKGLDYSSSWTYCYNLNNQSWTFHPLAYHPSSEDDNKTNFINNKKGELILYSSPTLNANVTPVVGANDEKGFYKWADTRQATRDSYFLHGDANEGPKNLILYKTKDITFDNPASKKSVFSVQITYRCSGDSDLQAKFYTNGYKGLIPETNGVYRNDDAYTFQNSQETNADGDSFYSSKFMSTGGKWERVTLKPTNSSNTKSIYSFQLMIYNSQENSRQPDDFAINDISIVYRAKGTHFEKGE